MKTNVILVLTISTTLAGLTRSTLAQVDPPPPAPPLPSLPPFPAIEPAEIRANVERHLAQARAQIAQATAAARDAVAAVGGAGGGMDQLLRSPVPASRALVIQSTEMDPKTVAAAEEDLNVMARLLEKALIRDTDKEERRAMGIAISSMFGSPGSVRNIYLDGYGAIFFLDVKFPLLPPPKKEETSKTKEPTSSDWEETRDELYGDHSPDTHFNLGFKRSFRDGGEDYDEEKVERLKDSLLEALKNAAHIRNLKPDELVTVVISGGQSPRAARYATTRKSGEGKAVVRSLETLTVLGDAPKSPARRDTTMTLRVKKSDVDSFAKDKLTLDGFRKKVAVRIY